MLATTERMARKSKEPTEVVRIKRDLADMISTITGITHQSVADLLDPILRPFLIRREREALEQRQKQIESRQNGNEDHQAPRRKKAE